MEFIPKLTRCILTTIKATNIVRHEGHVSREQRESLLRQQGVLLWLTGLPSSGKSTIAYTVEHALDRPRPFGLCARR